LTVVTTTVYIAGVFSNERYTERILEHTSLIELRFFKARENATSFWDQDQFEVFKEFIKNWISTFCWSLETDCKFILHWSDLSLSSLYLFLLTFMICCTESLSLVDFCVNLSIVLKLLLSSW